MRRLAGTLLMAFAVLGAAGAVLMVGGSIVEMGRTYPTSDRFAAAEGGLLLAGAVLALAAILFVTGRQLRGKKGTFYFFLLGGHGRAAAR